MGCPPRCVCDTACGDLTLGRCLISGLKQTPQCKAEGTRTQIFTQRPSSQLPPACSIHWVLLPNVEGTSLTARSSGLCCPQDYLSEAAPAVLGALGEKEPSNHPAMWDAVLSFAKAYPQVCMGRAACHQDRCFTLHSQRLGIALQTWLEPMLGGR